MRAILSFIVFAVLNLNAQSPVVSNDSITERYHKYTISQTCDYLYNKPTFWQNFKYVPDDLYQFGKFTTKKENLLLDGAVLGSTGVLLPFDDEIQIESGKLGDKLGGWDEDSHYKKVLGLKIVPENLSSAVYYIGNGGTTILLSGMFFTIGKLNGNDYRALHTSGELLECLIATGIASQTVKRITGRQSPARAIRDGNAGGDWQPFPSFGQFQKDTPNYDAMPSGHLATLMATIVVITTNYPEIVWIKPVAYSLLTLLSYNMLSTKVHWASDYPLGLFMGYVIGKTIAERRITKREKVAMADVKKKAKVSYNMGRIGNQNLYGATLTF